MCVFHTVLNSVGVFNVVYIRACILPARHIVDSVATIR